MINDFDVKRHLNCITPSDQVIAKIKDLIKSGVLKPGDRLPAERKMAEDFGFGRTQIREALHKLEFYGLIKTLPQSGSIITQLDISALDGLITDVLNLQEYDFFSLVEMRVILEVNAIKLCATRRTEKDLKLIEYAHQDFVRYWDTDERVTYDFAFHRAIAEGSHNPLFKSMLMIVTPEILNIYNTSGFCKPDTVNIQEHFEMLQAIQVQDANKAAEIMTQHLQGVLGFATLRLKERKK